jgi:hypothetical protein
MNTLQIPSKYTKLLTGKYTVLMLLDAVYHNGVIHNEYIAFKDEAELKQYFPDNKVIPIPSGEFLEVLLEVSDGLAAINL